MAVLKFTKTHEWARVEGDMAVIGVSDYAQKELGDIVFVELPNVGDRVEQSYQLGTIESTKAASELHVPLTGEVVEVNNALVNNPQWINQDPMVKGWMVKVKIENPAELDNLLGEIAYKEFVEKESK